ncbi:MAG: phosphodiester glycosidase family protein [Clostridiales bacterium]|nr:phosphodiester glycosidase family protein [Clostridiales bacterium]
MKKLVALAILLCLLPLAGLGGQEYHLPLDLNLGGSLPNPAGFTAQGYEDESISLSIETRDFEKNVRAYIVRVTVKSPTQLHTAIARKPNDNWVARPLLMAKAKNAVFAINGECYVQRTRDSFVYRQGQVIRNKPDPMKDVLVIDEQGDFHVFVSQEKDEEIHQYLASGGTIVNAFSFGPALVIDGKVVTTREDYYFNPKEKLPRSVIAQTGPLSYMFVEIEGARGDCFTHQQMADFMGELGVVTAYNLDGGQSSVMVFNNKFLDRNTSNTERDQSDIIYVASSIGGE